MWDPKTYLTFADHRGRAFFELLARVDAAAPRRVVDLGCGPGNLTATLTERWPDAVIEGYDSSPEMIAEARELGLDAEVLDVRDWHPEPDTDVVVTNALLQWIPSHATLLRSWPAALPSGAVIAMQVPGNFDAPSHMAVRSLVVEEHWRDKITSLRDAKSVLTPEEYATLLTDAGCTVDAWETTYVQQLSGDDPVLDWITGTALRPIKAELTDTDWQAFRAELAPKLRQAYPQRADGTTWFPFRRIFAVATVR
ncbi:trans-aconitate 2-methyltransferase [Herbihabitans rhizosphaerae]|uniref:Trans-aconitate 2-methyltransferase n=1 Tax=Herbihabitans rhizosphaerae TaxID=1872711 RepID=A0A4Q7KBE9_9PSEU|nr:trans-aconitate 2-methyltransferase [Herbihabitans rhizosphaerae]RZS29653.1 trans-aconitate 2-methyltransferase [Herbihabitans rhizosphaerae]